MTFCFQYTIFRFIVKCCNTLKQSQNDNMIFLNTSNNSNFQTRCHPTISFYFHRTATFVVLDVGQVYKIVTCTVYMLDLNQTLSLMTENNSYIIVYCGTMSNRWSICLFCVIIKRLVTEIRLLFKNNNKSMHTPSLMASYCNIILLITSNYYKYS